MDEFLNCAKKLFIKESIPNLNCTIYNFKEFIDPAMVHVPLCNNTELAAEMHQSLMEYYNSNFLWESKDSKCPVPCMQTNYNYEINYYSKRSFSDLKNQVWRNQNTLTSWSILLKWNLKNELRQWVTTWYHFCLQLEETLAFLLDSHFCQLFFPQLMPAGH